MSHRSLHQRSLPLVQAQQCGPMIVAITALLMIVGAGAPATASNSEDPYATAHQDLGFPGSPTGKRLASVVMMLKDKDVAKANAFLQAAGTPTWLDAAGRGELVARARMVWASLEEFEVVGVMKEGPTTAAAVLETPDGNRLRILLEHEAEAPHRIVSLDYAPDTERGPQIPDFTSLDEADAFLTRLADANDFSGVLLVAENDEVVFEKGYGFADRKSRRKVEPTTRFNVGSITKDLTRSAVLQLEAAGKLSLDDRLGKFLPSFPAVMRDKITVEQLLGMTSGLGDYHQSPEWQERRHELENLDDLLSVISRTDLLFEPGTSEMYSNSGYAVLGGVIAAAAGTDFYDYMARAVFAKAGMTHSGFLTERDDTIAIGYTKQGPGAGDAWRENVDMVPIKGSPAGSSYSTARDLLAFYLAQKTGKLAAGPDAARPGCWAGGGPGVSTVACHDLKEGHHVIVLSNVDPPLGERVGSKLARALADQ